MISCAFYETIEKKLKNDTKMISRQVAAHPFPADLTQAVASTSMRSTSAPVTFGAPVQEHSSASYIGPSGDVSSLLPFSTLLFDPIFATQIVVNALCRPRGSNNPVDPGREVSDVN